MDKISNCPNNVFDCGVSCGLNIMTEAVLKILKEYKEPIKIKENIIAFNVKMHNEITEKHVEHMNARYQWEKILDDSFK